jgi:hypothetical protein
LWLPVQFRSRTAAIITLKTRFARTANPTQHQTESTVEQYSETSHFNR